MSFGSDFGAFSAVMLGLVLFGLAFNAFIDWAHRRGYDEGYTAFLVVVGVLVTIGAWAISPTPAQKVQQVALLVAYFTASGLPMVIGDVVRHVKARRRTLQLLAGQLTAQEE